MKEQKEQTVQNTKKPTKICLKCKRGLRSNVIKCTSCGCTDIMDKKQYQTLIEQYKKSSFKEKQKLKNSPEFASINKYKIDINYNKHHKNNNRNSENDDSYDLSKSIVGMLFIVLAVILFFYGILELDSILLGFILAVICLLISYGLINSISQKNLHPSKQINKIKAQESQIQQHNVPKCPTCGSTNVKRITTTNRAVSILTLGILSGKIGKNYECLDCKVKW